MLDTLLLNSKGHPRHLTLCARQCTRGHLAAGECRSQSRIVLRIALQSILCGHSESLRVILVLNQVGFIEIHRRAVECIGVGGACDVARQQLQKSFVELDAIVREIHLILAGNGVYRDAIRGRERSVQVAAGSNARLHQVLQIEVRIVE